MVLVTKNTAARTPRRPLGILAKRTASCPMIKQIIIDETATGRPLLICITVSCVSVSVKFTIIYSGRQIFVISLEIRFRLSSENQWWLPR